MLLVDGSSLLHRVLHTPQGELTTSDGKPSGGVHGFLTSLNALCKRKYCREGIIVAFDEGIPLHRREIFNNYKPHKIPVGNVDQKFMSTLTGTVASDPVFLDKYVFSRDLLHKKILPKLGCISVRVPNAEADDIIAAWCKFANMDTITILSSDRDLYQLLTDDIDQYDGMYHKFTTKDSLIKDYNLDIERYRENYILHKALAGDGSDGIPSPPGIGGTSAAKYTKQLIDLWKDIGNVSMSLELLSVICPKLTRPSGAPVTPYENLKKSAELIWRNYCLTDLYYAIDNCLPMMNEIKAAFARTKLDVVDEYGVGSLLDSLQMKSAKATIPVITESNMNDDVQTYLEKFI